MSRIADGCRVLEEVSKPLTRHRGGMTAGVPGGDLHGTGQGDGLGIAVPGAARLVGGGEQELEGTVSGGVREQRASGRVSEILGRAAGAGCVGRGLFVVA